MADTAQRRERRVVRAVFLSGVLAGSVLIAAGLVEAIVRGRMRVHAVTVGALAHGLAALQPSAVITLGLLVLLLTPITGVFVLIVGFAREHDTRFALVAMIVAALLVIGVVLGRA